MLNAWCSDWCLWEVVGACGSSLGCLGAVLWRALWHHNYFPIISFASWSWGEWFCSIIFSLLPPHRSKTTGPTETSKALSQINFFCLLVDYLGCLVIVMESWLTTVSVRRQMNKERDCLCMTEYYSFIKRWNPVICTIANNLGRQHVKWNVSTER